MSPTPIEWCDETLNPLGWGCYGPGGTPEAPRRCPWCYAHRQARRGLRDCPLCRQFVPHRHPEVWRAADKWRKPKVVFLQSMGDLWGAGVSDEWRGEVLDQVQRRKQHTFIALTKQPRELVRYCDWLATAGGALGLAWRLPENLVVGTSATCQSEVDQRLGWLRLVKHARRALSLEPYLQPVDLRPWLRDLDWVIVGGLTGPKPFRPPSEWMWMVVRECRRAGVPVFVKDNAGYGEVIHGTPWGGREHGGNGRGSGGSL